MRKILYAIALPLVFILVSTAYGQKRAAVGRIVCNPMNLSYRFCLDTPSRREAADPVVVRFRDGYYLFASKSGGYWHSRDLINWKLVTTTDLPLEDYAPAVVEMKGELYFIASGGSRTSKIYKTADPLSGKWTLANPNFPIAMIDPDLFLDDDGRLYFYYGCSNVDPIYAVELDTATLMPIGNPVACFNSRREIYGWERPGDYNTKKETAPWIEGAWMTKYNGRYYLQYAGPGTEYKSYADAVYVSDHPLGPFTLADHNPVSYKPEGFAAGAGHSSTFQDVYGNYWHISTMTISVKHMFERRLGLFPMFFDERGELYTATAFGDFPFRMPDRKIKGPEELFPNWMLLSYAKPVAVSSELPEHSAMLASDEDIRTYLAAKTRERGEWISIDLQKECRVNAVQVNFAEHDMQIYGRKAGVFYQYILEYSVDGKNWKVLADRTANTEDAPHEFVALKKAVKARYIRLTNHYFPDGKFAVSDLRVFGSDRGAAPKEEIVVTANRNPDDRCVVELSWNADKDAVGYTIRFGTDPDRLYNSYQVLGKDRLILRSLNARQKYYFRIDSFNGSGVKKGTKVVAVD